MLDYIIKVLLFQTLFLAVYDLFLKRETFFQWNRVYLMATSVLAYIIPNIKISKVQEIIPQEYVVMLPEVILNPTAVIEQQFDWSILFFLVLKVIFWFGVVVATLMFAYKLYQIIDLIRTNDKEITSNYYLVWLKNNKAFSFFNYIFLGKESNNKTQIIEHELVHVKQKHSLDLLFFELQKILFWFNPYSYLYQTRISELHEFIADSKAVKTENKATYFNNLLSETFGVQKISFINPFLKQSLIKKRILMLNKNKSKQILKFKYVLLIPVLAGMLVYSSCGKSQSTVQKNNSEVSVGLDELVLGTYFQITTGVEAPKGNKISYESLSAAEKAEYNKWKQWFLAREKKDVYEYKEFSIYEMGNDTKTIFGEIDWKNKKNDVNKTTYVEDVPFAIIEKSPIFPGCEDGENSKRCLQESIQKHVAKKFNTSLAQNLGLSPGKKRVITVFKIDKEGNIVDVRSRGPHADLEAEAIRVVKSIPKMIPGEFQGKKVNVKYTLPITLMITAKDNDKGFEKSQPIDEIVIKDGVPFAIIEKAPVFPDCENSDDPKKCLQESIQKHVARKFNTGLAQNLGLSPGKKRVITVFKIDKEGNIVDVRSRGPHADLEAEAIRVVKSIPKMIPGEFQGEKVNVKYTLPITLMINPKNNNTQGESTFESQPKIVSSQNSAIADGIISGVVNGNVSGNLKGLPGVIILVKGKNKGSTTDFNGNFKMKANKGETLIFSFKGFPNAEVKINENNNYIVTM